MPTPVSLTERKTYEPAVTPARSVVAPLNSALPLSTVTVPPSGMASRALTTRFTRIWSNWSAIGADVTGAGVQIQDQPQIRADQLADHRLDPADGGVDVEHVGRDDLPAAEGQELPGQGGGALGSVADLVDTEQQAVGIETVRVVRGKVL